MVEKKSDAWRHLPDFLDAKTTLAILGIRPQTLYAYVSRSAIRSIPQTGTKAHLYSRADVERVAARAAARAGHGPVAASAMDHGAPIVRSGITEIGSEGPSYRGHLATRLAENGVSFEEVCELLWAGSMQAYETALWLRSDDEWASIADAKSMIFSGVSQEEIFPSLAMLTLQLARKEKKLAAIISQSATHENARTLIRAMAQALEHVDVANMPGPRKATESIANVILNSLGCAQSDVHLSAVNCLLVLLADHELPPGTLAVRAAASGGASLFECIAAGICTSAGTEIALHYDAVDHFLSARPSFASLKVKVERLRSKGLRIPGFSHPLYPNGDPRARLMMKIAAEIGSDIFSIEQVQKFVHWAGETLGEHPRHEFGTVCLIRALGLPAWAGGALFLLARTAGWTAHFEEQRSALGLWRPRAQFVSKDGGLPSN